MTNFSDTLQLKSALACITSAACLFIAAPLLAQDQDAATAQDAATEQDPAELGKLEVTGSRIRRLDVEGPSPIVIVTREDIVDRGFATVYEALENLTQNTGTLQGEQFTNSFTPNAQSLSLRSLGGGRTLVLMNGRRVADYPQPFNSQSNFFNFATVPIAAVERIEVLTGSASAIYGSDAVAGVINIILRDDIVAPTLTARVGTTAEGGGDSEYFSVVWGKQWDRASFTVAAEHHSIDPIYGKDRSYLDSVDDAPQLAGQVPLTRSALKYFGFYGTPHGGSYFDPGEAACEGLQGSGVPYEYAFRQGSGNYCGRDDFGDETLQNERDRGSAYLNFKYDISDSTTFYTDVMYWDSSASLQGFHMWWGSGTAEVDDVWDASLVTAAGATGDWVRLQRVFHPNETGVQESTYEESAENYTMGFEGSFSNFWNWEVGASYSTNDFHARQDLFKEEVANTYFAGSEKINICPLLGFNCVLMRPDYSTAEFDMYDALTPEDLAVVIGRMSIDSDASVSSFFAETNGDLMEMKHGPLQFAAVLEYASQEYLITPDDRLLNQEGEGWWGRSGAGGGGDRDRYAAGIEFGIPVTEKFRATLALRYDQYEDISDTGGASTYGIGLEYRPNDSLLLRGSFNTSFRAPDMHYLFSDLAGFFTGSYDIWDCRQDAIDGGYEYNELGCTLIGVEGTRIGVIGLEEEEGESLTLGFVFSPVNNFSINIDYYELELENAVEDRSITQILRDEADCQLGVDTSGNTVDPASQLCVDVLGRVTRTSNLPGQFAALDFIHTNPINSAFRKQTGFDAALDYTVETAGSGDFNFRVDYTHVLSDVRQVYVEDPKERDYRDNLQNFNARSVVNFTGRWDYKQFTGVLYAHRLGSMPNWQETGRLSTWTTYNASATMRFFEEKLIASLIVSNLTDERPPVDDGFTTWPFFWRGQYNARGRETYLQLSYTFE
jgi:outer membrane receptor protein involved in Fe transport